MGLSGQLFIRSRYDCFDIYFSIYEARIGINHTMSFERAHIEDVTTVYICIYIYIYIMYIYIIRFLTQHGGPNKRIKKTKIRFSYIDNVPHMVCLNSGDNVTIDLAIVTRTREKPYPTHQVSILFTAIFTTRRVRIIFFLSRFGWFSHMSE